VALLGPLLYAKLSGQTPQVKKAALEVIRTMAHMSNCSKLRLVVFAKFSHLCNRS
jgi:hypothetical protein